MQRKIPVQFVLEFITSRHQKQKKFGDLSDMPNTYQPSPLP